MTVDFNPLGRAVDSRRIQTALGLSRAHLHKLVMKTYDVGMGAALPRPVGVLGATMVWDIRDLEKAVPGFLAARKAAESRIFEKVRREPVDFEELEKRREDFKGMPHVLGLMDAVMIAEHFELGQNGARYPGEWAAREVLLPAHAGVIGSRRVWRVEDVKEREPLILRHLERRRELEREKLASGRS